MPDSSFVVNPERKMKKQSTTSGQPLGTLDERLNQYTGKVLFPEKLARAKKMLAAVGLPAAWVKEGSATAKAAASAGTRAKPAAKPVSEHPKKAA